MSWPDNRKTDITKWPQDDVHLCQDPNRRHQPMEQTWMDEMWACDFQICAQVLGQPELQGLFVRFLPDGWFWDHSPCSVQLTVWNVSFLHSTRQFSVARGEIKDGNPRFSTTAYEIVLSRDCIVEETTCEGEHWFCFQFWVFIQQNSFLQVMQEPMTSLSI